MEFSEIAGWASLGIPDNARAAPLGDFGADAAQEGCPMSIQWRDEMAIDNGLIDRDHQTLIAIINEFCDATPHTEELSKLQNILAKLEHYAERHFEREESLQRAAHYAYIDAHHREHRDLGNQLSAIRDQLTKLNPPVGSPQNPGDQETPEAAPASATEPIQTVAQVHAEIVNLLHHWLVDHIIRSDLRMKPYAAKMAEHAGTLQPLTRSVSWV
jgi:hemerythrin